MLGPCERPVSSTPSHPSSAASAGGVAQGLLLRPDVRGRGGGAGRMILYWMLAMPWVVRRARLAPPPLLLGPRARVALAIASPAVMYLLFWWGGLGFGAVLLIAAAFPRAGWPARGT